MDQRVAVTNEGKSKSKWQLFTNDGRFDSKLPPYQRLRQKSAMYYSKRNDSRLPRPRQSSG